MFPFVKICTALLLTEFALAASTYDQRQTGDLNVRVDLKDLQIIALMKSGKEEYVDYDYAYDYSEMTIKPQNGTTPKPLVSSSIATDILTDNTTIETTVSVETTAVPIKNSTGQNLEIVGVSDHPANDSTTTVKTVEQSTKTEITEITTATAVTPVSPNTGCKKGFILNQKGGCELKIQSASNALLKIIKLSQKLKRRENRKDVEDKQ